MKYSSDKKYIYYPNTNIPVNKLGIRSAEEIDELEAQLFLKTYEHFHKNLDKKVCFNQKYLKDLQKFAFAKLYSWAGKYRNKNVSNLEFIKRTNLHETDSRIFGGLRVQEGSRYVALAKKKGLLGDKNDDFLGYKCIFLHDDVAELERIFIQWEKATVKLVRVIPKGLRMEVYNMNFMLMEELVADFIDNSGKNKEAILEKYASARRNFLAGIRDECNLWTLDPEAEKLLEEYLLRAETLNEGGEVLGGQRMGIGKTKGA